MSFSTPLATASAESGSSESPRPAFTLEQDLPESFASLGPDFSSPVRAAPLPAPYLVGFAREAAALIGLPDTAARDDQFIQRFSGTANAGEAPPLATVYSGHQFGVWAGQLGDGRALLLGESNHGAARYEVQLKGSGLTPYSRMGDGRAVLRSSIREFLCSEAMHHLGVPTTRALCVIGSDLPVRRETVETAAVVTRIAPSFVRFGHFEHFASQDRIDLLERLADHVIARHMPQCRQAADPYLALLEEAVRSTADLLAQWQSLGFCHGVMNTDNMSILGLTIDYGPFGFIDGFDANHICNHSDSGGRYAYRMQPPVAQWNLVCLAQSLLPLIGAQRGTAGDERAVDDARAALGIFKTRYAAAFDQRMHAKLGLRTQRNGDTELIDRLFAVMNANRADFTLTFRRLSAISQEGAVHESARGEPARDLFLDRAAFDAWANDYRARLGAENQHDKQPDAQRAAAMDRVNPKYILRNHLAEIAITAAREKNFSELSRLQDVLRRPFDEQPEHESYAALPPQWAASLEVSCSS